MRRTLLVVALAVLAGCSRSSGGSGGSSTAVAPLTSAPPSPASGAGPRVIFDAQLRADDPTPSPWPNDSWTVPDPTRPTGKRLALPYPTTTNVEARLAAGVGSLDGFGTATPIAVRFDGPIDLASVTKESVLVVNVTPGHPHFGRVATLDVGPESFFPVKREKPHAVFSPVEPFAGAEDTIFRPGNRRALYEDETDTLLLRPLVPLDEGAEHAVVILDTLRGTNGDAVRAPAGVTVIPGQAAGVARAASVVSQLKLPGQVAFAWTFTTQSVTAIPLALAEGLHGRGPFAALAQAYPPRFDRIEDLGYPGYQGDSHTLSIALLRNVFSIAQPIASALGALAAPGSPVATGASMFGSGIYDFESVNYVVFGSYRSPSFVKGGGGRFDVDLARGVAKQTPDDVTFLVAVPRPTAANGFKQPPYPCVVFGHGIYRSKLDALGVASELARAGFATVAIDAYGHGPDDALSHLGPELAGMCQGNTALTLAAAGGLTSLAALAGKAVNPLEPLDQLAKDATSAPLFAPLCREGRAPDVDGDGLPDSGGAFWSADPTTTRDQMLQTALDTVQLFRILKACGTDVNGDGHLDREEGDFHQTGLADVGGPNVSVCYLGQSLGSLIGSSIVALAPEADAAVLNVAGSALFLDAAPRGSFEMVSDAIPRIAWGSAVTGTAAPGSTITLSNARASATATTTTGASGDYFLSVKADAGDALALEVRDPSGASRTSALVAATSGLGLGRNTPAYRRYLDLGAMALDGADSVNWAPRWRQDPLPGRSAKRVLIQLSRNDWAMPTASGIGLARAAGFVSPARGALLLALGYLAGTSTANVDRDHGVESAQDFGVRFFGVDSHFFLSFPNAALPQGADYTLAAQQQAGEFLATGKIDDSFPILQR